MRIATRAVSVVVLVGTFVALVPRGPEPAEAQVAFTAGELLGKPTATSITVNVVPSQSVWLRAQYGTSSGAPYDGTTGTVNAPAGQGSEITVTGLSPNTRYYYRVQFSTSGSGGPWLSRPEGTFHTQRAEGSSFTFAMQSDAHIVGGPDNNMAIYANTVDNMVDDSPDFLVDLGDMFAVTTSSAATEAEYLSQRGWLEPLSRDAAVYLAIGNHENEEGWWRTGPSPSTPIWSINARKEFFANPVPDGFYSGDSQNYSDLGVDGDGRRETYYAWEWGDALFVVLDPFWNTMIRPHSSAQGEDPFNTPLGDRWDWTLGVDQYLWLRNTLATSTKRLKFVFTHQLVGGVIGYGRGGALAVDAGFEWGADPATFAANRPAAQGWVYGSIHQMLVEHGVDAVFHGHDHCWARETRTGINYVEVPMPNAAGPEANFCGGYYVGTIVDNSGHVRVEVAPSGAEVSFVRGATDATDGTIAASFSMSSNSPNVAPDADAGGDFVVGDSDHDGSQTVALDGAGSSDADGTIVAYRWLDTDGYTVRASGVSASVNLDVGEHDFILEVEDDDGIIDRDPVTVTVNPTPVADAGSDRTVVDADDDTIHAVTLDGSASTDDGTIVGYSWRESGVEIATGVEPTVDLGLGTHLITLRVTDDHGLADTDTVQVKVTSPPVIPDPAGGEVTVQARYGNHVGLTGFGGGAAGVTVTFADPGGGVTCAAWATQNGGGNPDCDVEAGWQVTATGPGGPATTVVRDLEIVDFDPVADTVTVVVNDPAGALTYGCGGNVALAYGGDVDDGPTATRMVTRAGRSMIDLSKPGPCAGGFDNTTANVGTGGAVYLTAWDGDGDRTLETRVVHDVAGCPTTATPFHDVPSTSYAFGDVECLWGLELTTGTSATTYSPYERVTREQMAAFLARLVRLLGIDEPGANQPFADVPTSSYAHDDIALIHALGITTGTTPTTYSPHDQVTREQMAAFLARLVRLVTA